MRSLLAVAALCVAGPAVAQTCPPLDLVPRDGAKLEWPAVTQWEDGSALAADVRITYIVYERVDGLDVRRCTTQATTAGFVGLSVGTHTWFVTAMTAASEPAWVSSDPSPTWSKTILAAPTRRRLMAPTGLSGI